MYIKNLCKPQLGSFKGDGLITDFREISDLSQ
jgi:hypothetical protein